MAVSAITKINAVLKKNGREERLVKGRGYYYLQNCNFRQTGIYTNLILPEHYENTLETVVDMFKQNDINLTT